MSGVINKQPKTFFKITNIWYSMNEEPDWESMYDTDDEEDELDLYRGLKDKKESKKEKEKAIASYIG